MERVRIDREAKMSPEELRTIRVPGSLSLFLSRLDEEYNKLLQRISPHSIDYVMRLRDEVKLVELLTVFQRYYDRVGLKSVSLIRLIYVTYYLFYFFFFSAFFFAS
jgi:translation initiation factor 3 subunit C